MAEEAELLARSRLYSGPIFDLRQDRVRLPNGRVADLDVIAHPGAAAVVPIDPDGQVLLLRQYRYATGRWLLEVPAGKLAPGERPADCAGRELEEETGFTAGRLDELGSIWTTPGFTDERIWLYLARDLRPGRRGLEPDEVLEPASLPWGEVLARVADGGISDAKSVCSLLFAQRLLAREQATAAAGPRLA